MKVAGIKHTSLADGRGLNYVIFLQGCERGCKDCHNPSTWDKDGGTEMSLETLKEDIKRYCPPITGVTFSGGEPILQLEEVIALAEWAKSEGLETNLYTGFKVDEVIEKMRSMGVKEAPFDSIFDGAFEANKTFPSVPFRGSYNQRWYHHVGGTQYSD